MDGKICQISEKDERRILGELKYEGRKREERELKGELYEIARTRE